MHQTMFALLGMMLATMMAFNQQRAVLETRQAMLNDEMEVMATGIAMQAMEYIGNKSFDQSTVDQGVPAWLPTRLKNTASLSLTRTMPTGRRCTLLPEFEGEDDFATCDDLSDFNQMTAQQVPFEVGDQTLYFEVSAQVRYLDSSRRPMASGTSKHKEVVVKVTQVPINGRRELLQQPVYLSRTFSIP